VLIGEADPAERQAIGRWLAGARTTNELANALGIGNLPAGSSDGRSSGSRIACSNALSARCEGGALRWPQSAFERTSWLPSRSHLDSTRDIEHRRSVGMTLLAAP
jgi:hypothetical protein